METDLLKVQRSEGSEDGLFQANLEAFNEHAPYLHKQLVAIDAPHSRLLVEPDGSVDMVLLGKRFYNCDACRFAEEQIAAYFESPHRFVLAEPNPEFLEGLNAEFCKSLKAGASDLGVEFDLKHCPDESHFLMVFGIGLGLHIDVLAERTQARVVCLVEPTIEVLYHSLHVTEWRPIFERFEDEDRELTFIVERSPKRIARKLQTTLRRNLATFVDGIYLYTHYRSAILQQSLDLFRKDLGVALAGLGYFEDEVIMTANATANLAGRDVMILSGAHPPKDAPVFIVGSGPSVDQDLDFIVANHERAIIFSIGTALRILLSRGVTPDFHFEIENSAFNAGLMASTAEEFDLAGVTLVASTTVRSRMLSFMDQAYLFFREELSGTKLYAGDLRLLQPAGPTVANAALAAGLRMGFREYYLFGVDMGTRTEGNFHAQGSVYSLGRFKDFSTEDNRFPANFGGEVYGERVLNWARNTLESVISAYPDITVFNCSDGARIAGAIPKVSRTVEMTNAALDRGAIKREIAKYLSVVSKERTADLWCQETRNLELRNFLERLEAILAPLADDPDPKDHWMREIVQVTKETRLTNPIVTSYLNGSLQIMVGVSRWYDRRIEEACDRGKFRRHASAVLLEWIRGMGRDLSELYQEVEDHFHGRIQIEDLHRHGEDDLLLPAD